MIAQFWRTGSQIQAHDLDLSTQSWPSTGWTSVMHHISVTWKSVLLNILYLTPCHLSFPSLSSRVSTAPIPSISHSSSATSFLGYSKSFLSTRKLYHFLGSGMTRFSAATSYSQLRIFPHVPWPNYLNNSLVIHHTLPTFLLIVFTDMLLFLALVHWHVDWRSHMSPWRFGFV